MTFRKQDNTRDWERKDKLAICGELALEEAMDLSQENYEMNERTN